MLRLVTTLLVLTSLTVAACRSSGGGDPDGREDELRETVPAAYTAIFAGGAVEAYGYASSDFKEKCSLEDFTGVIAFVKVFLGDLEEDDIEVEVTDVRFEDDRAYVTATGSIQGEDFSPDEDDDEFSDYWVYEDGEWKWGTDDEDPCDSNFTTDGDDEDEETPVTGPGSSRDEALPLGESIDVESIRYTVIEADLDAAAQLETLSDFPSTPEPGRRVVLARVRAEHIGEESDDSIEVYESDFSITGSNNVLYSSFDEGVSCGFVEDTLSGEMFAGGELEGYVCFQVPEDETELLLVIEPSLSFDNEGRRFLALE
jgi:hypothetical protein